MYYRLAFLAAADEIVYRMLSDRDVSDTLLVPF